MTATTTLLRGVCVAALCVVGTACTDPIARLSTMTPPATAPPTDAPYVEATWMGTAGVLLDDGTTAILIDPFVSRPSLGKVATGARIEVDEARIDRWMQMPGVERTAAVVVTHSHYDHLMDAPSFARRTEATLVGSASTVFVGRTSGLSDAKLHEVTPSAPMRFGDFTVTLLTSRHGPALLGSEPYPGNVTTCFELPAKAKDYRTGGTYAVLVQHPAGTVLHHGSAAWVPGMYDAVEADLVLLGLAGRKDTGEYLRAVVDGTGARRVVPIHWDNFFRGFDVPQASLSAARINEFLDHVSDTRPDLSVQALPLGHARTLLAR